MSRHLLRSRWLVLAATVLMGIAIVMPDLPFPGKKFDFFMLVDITRSMNVRDYQTANGEQISRLEKVKNDMLASIRGLPCGSRVGVGIFTERTPTLLYTPVEICEDFTELQETIERIDWRMAWVADSNIMLALANSIELSREVQLDDSTLLFFTDGHEAPPANPRYQPDLQTVQKGPDESLTPVKGMIVGTGDTALSRIPKFNEDGEQIGYYSADDVPHKTTFGLPEDPDKVEGYVPRNAPWGKKQQTGNEHLSSVRVGYLEDMAGQAGMHFHHLQTPGGLLTAMTHADFARPQLRKTDLSAIPASLSLLLLVITYLPALRWPAGRGKKVKTSHQHHRKFS